MIESRLQEIADDLSNLYALKRQIAKERGQPSPGLLDSIRRLETRQETFKESLELWKAVLRVYPNYDR